MPGTAIFVVHLFLNLFLSSDPNIYSTVAFFQLENSNHVKTKFRQTSNRCKRVIEVNKLMLIKQTNYKEGYQFPKFWLL